MSVEIFNLYNRLVESHGLVPYRSYSKHREVCDRFDAWCSGKGVDPERWILARHSAIKWRHKIAIRVLPSDKFLVKFEDWGDRVQAADVLQDRLGNEATLAVYPSRYMKEILRRSYANEQATWACLADPQTHFDDQSKICSGCDQRELCSARSI